MLENNAASKIRVLVAEDNPALALVVRLHLENAGFQVTVARNGAEAWSLLQRQDFEVFVTDHQMPELPGAEVCRRMRQEERLAQVGVVMLTAKAQDADIFRGWSSGVSAYLTKPFNPLELLTYVKRIFSSAEDRDDSGDKTYKL
jgi:two-component system alkaline phosphatase synthesis response regulator PhoP/two-component system response regulator VicR